MVKKNKEDDFALIRHYQQGDDRAFSELFHKFYPHVYQTFIMKGIPQTEAEDFTSEIFIKLLDALKNYRFEKPFEHYLRRIVRNKIFDFYRKKQIEWYLLDLQYSVATNSNYIEQAELEEIINLCLQQIKSLTRRAIILLWLEGYKRRQIAETLTLPLGTVHSNLERGKDDFRNCIRDKL